MRTLEASKRLCWHPANVVLRVARNVGALEECWPQIDDGFVETLRVAYAGYPVATSETGTGGTIVQPELPTEARPSVSESAMQVLDKLERRKHWGSNQVSLDTLRNHFCRGIAGVDEALEELVDQGLVLTGGSRKGPYSLDTGRKAQIEEIVGLWRRRSRGGLRPT